MREVRWDFESYLAAIYSDAWQPRIECPLVALAVTCFLLLVVIEEIAFWGVSGVEMYL